MNGSGKVGGVARMLGFAGLLPQVVATGLLGTGHFYPGVALSVIYPLLILSFLGGIWWGFAMQRQDGAQGRLAALAVVPSLLAGALLILLAITMAVGWTLVAIGSAVTLTLLVDRHLVSTGEAPAGWMALRIPLSLGLGVLTIAAGVLVGR